MIRKCISISLILCVLGSLFQFTVSLSWYISNYSHIKSNLCINRNNPNIDCDGLCQLSKKLDKQENNPDQKTAKTTELSKRIDFFASSNIISVNTFSRATFKPLAIYKFAHSSWFSEPALPPPQLG